MAKDKKKKKGPPTWAIILGVLFVLAVIGGVMGSKQKEKDKGEREQAMKDAVLVEAQEIFKNYKDNEVGAESKYKDKWAKISGKVDRIDSSLGGGAYVYLDGGDVLFGLRCEVEKERVESIANLKPGDAVMMVCRGKGKFGDVLFEACEMAPKEEAKPAPK